MADIWRKIGLIVLGMAVVINFAIVAKCAFPKYQEWQNNIAQQATLQTEVDNIRSQITQTKRNIDRFKTSPYFIERLARQSHRVADNEVVFIFR